MELHVITQGETSVSRQILITGGAGFIGSHLADELIAHGYRVRVLDAMLAQVHGEAERPPYLHPDVELLQGDVTDRHAVAEALRGVDAIYHFAARVGVGQSMYEIEQYTSTNDVGTAVLLEALISQPVERLVVASSMSVYGEGMYQRHDGTLLEGKDRSLWQLAVGKWEVLGPNGDVLTPLPTPEVKTPSLASVYALNKYAQEQMCHIVGRAYNIPTVALRFFNVYGTRQALSNPYTGVLAIFASRLLNDRPPLIYEDGLQKRDFVNVRDVVQACRLAIETPGVAGETFNIGSGIAYTVRELGERMAAVLGKQHIVPQITGKYRAGDIRHCFADITKARQLLDYQPQVSLEDGLLELVEWLSDQIAVDQVEQANLQLAQRGLTV
jgi:dTDP-L-rhamnose 4-epimerase